MLQATARLLPPQDGPADLLHEIYQGRESDTDLIAGTCLIEVIPEKDFITYGIGVSLMTMGDPDQARGRVAINDAES